MTEFRKTELFSFAYFLDFNLAIKELAELAEPEVWDFSDEPPALGSNKILKNYLEYTFRKLKSDDQISFYQGRKYACFNTGLYTKGLENIYAYFEKNRNEEALSPYFFKAFCKASNFTLSRVTEGNLPKRANFFQYPGKLVYDPNIPLAPDYEHILEDNLERFPKIFERESWSERLRRLKGAIAETQKRVEANYKIAVPQFYNGNIQLLLPLRLTSGSSLPDLALATYREGNIYVARTCLTLKMAYSNARLIVQPQSSWLTTNI
mgnify:CR=1 FL=1